MLKRVEKFLGSPLPKALETRRERAARVMELDEAVSAAVAELKAKGFESPYLRAFVVARINPLRFKRGAKAEFDETIDKMLAGARRFDSGEDPGGSGRADRRRAGGVDHQLRRRVHERSGRRDGPGMLLGAMAMLGRVRRRR